MSYQLYHDHAIAACRDSHTQQTNQVGQCTLQISKCTAQGNHRCQQAQQVNKRVILTEMCNAVIQRHSNLPMALRMLLQDGAGAITAGAGDGNAHSASEDLPSKVY